jgi:putative transposase
MTPEGNLSQWMHQLKTAYTVYFNRRHQVVGHLFQGRFKSTVIAAEKYLLEVSRYLHLNPVRGVVLGPGNANGAPETSARVPLEQLPGLRRTI